MPKHNPHWAKQTERGHPFFLRLTILIVRYCPTWLIQLSTTLVSSYYYATAPKARANIRRYHQRLSAYYPDITLDSLSTYRQFRQFADAIADRFAVWQKKIKRENLVIHRSERLSQAISQPPPDARGEILICAHLGNIEITRAFLSLYRNFRLNVLIHNANAQAFNDALKQAGADDMRLIPVSQLDAALMLELKNRLEQGEWIAIAADRIPIRGEKIEYIDFLGKAAPFAQGPWLLAGLLEARINTIFAMKEKQQYHIYFQEFSTGLRWKRDNRNHIIHQAMTQYAQCLAEMAKRYPHQWYNFYDFWQDNP